MSNMEIKLDFSGLDELRKSPEITKLCKEKADQIANAADGNFTVEERQYKSRNTAVVLSADAETTRKQNKHGQIYDVVGGMMA